MVARLRKGIRYGRGFFKNVPLVCIGVTMTLLLLSWQPNFRNKKEKVFQRNQNDIEVDEVKGKVEELNGAVEKDGKTGGIVIEKEEEEIFEKQKTRTSKKATKSFTGISPLYLHSKVDSYGEVNGEVPEGVDMTISEEEMVISSATNVTPPDATVMIYNRVPKCGSSTTQALLRKLAARNSFVHTSSLLYGVRRLDNKERKDALQKLYMKTSKGARSHDRHMYYFNVTREGFRRPVWVNLVRDPVERFISDFYYVRSRDRWSRNRVLRSQKRPPKTWFKKNLDKCIVLDDPECRPVRGKLRELQLTYFCGQHPACLQVGNHAALQRAKRHAESYYSVVAVLEEYSLSFRVLEKYVPRFFANVTSLTQSSGNVQRRKTYAKPLVSEKTKAQLRSILREDMEFYDFVKQRLHKQAKALGMV